MPRTKNASNSKYYHYLLTEYNDIDNKDIKHRRYFRTQQEITAEYGLNRSAIYYIINPVEARKHYKYNNFKIEKVLVPTHTNTFTSPILI